jgi:hypothetical protein
VTTGVIIALGSLIVSALALFVAIWAQSRTGDLQERITKVEESRREDEIATRDAAQLRAIATGTGIQMFVNLVIVNQGAHDATQIEVYVTKRTDTETFIDHTEADRIVPGQPYAIGFKQLVYLGLPFTVDMAWSDGRDGRQNRTMEINTVEG